MSRLLLNALKGLESAETALLRPRTSLTMKNDQIFDLDINSFHSSYRNFWFNELAHDIKVECCKVTVDPSQPKCAPIRFRPGPALRSLDRLLLTAFCPPQCRQDRTGFVHPAGRQHNRDP